MNPLPPHATTIRTAGTDSSLDARTGLSSRHSKPSRCHAMPSQEPAGVNLRVSIRMRPPALAWPPHANPRSRDRNPAHPKADGRRDTEARQTHRRAADPRGSSLRGPEHPHWPPWAWPADPAHEADVKRRSRTGTSGSRCWGQGWGGGSWSMGPTMGLRLG